MKPLIAVFAKAPIPGRVKTRLVPPLTSEVAALLHERLVADVWSRLNALSDADCELHTDQHTSAWPEISPKSLQCDGDLGQRMTHAIEHGFTAGRPSVAIVGGDIPEFPVAALSAMLSSTSDVSFGPARDGGYYALVCRRSAPGMLAGVRWSTAHALADSIASCIRAGLNISIGQPWHDVDSEEDLHLLPTHLRP